MLERTFCHLKGIGSTTESKLWNSGILNWSDVSDCDNLPFKGAKLDQFRCGCQESIEHLKEKDALWFSKTMPSAEQWRMFPHFRDKVAYLDIETTGTDSNSSDITTIALWTGSEIKTYVQGQNLDQFEDEIAKYKMLVTFNGKCFDVPFIEKYFGIEVEAAHIDLRFVFRSLGITGGLKGIEHYFGMSRGDAEGLDGYFAVLLWNEYEMYGDDKALETLLAYNVLDSVNLENLMIKGYNMHIERFPDHNLAPLEEVKLPDNPYLPSLSVVDKIKNRF